MDVKILSTVLPTRLRKFLGQVIHVTTVKPAALPETRVNLSQGLCRTATVTDIFTDINNIFPDRSVLPGCHKTMTIVLKRSTVSCLKDYLPVTLTPTMMKCFERLVVKK